MIKKLLLTLSILLIILTIIITAIPKVIQFGAINFLNEQGIEANINDINMDIINGEFEIIDVHGKNSEGKGFNIGHLFINLDWSSFLDRSLIVKNITLNEFKLDTTHHKQTVKSIAGFKLIENNIQNSKPQEEKSTPAKNNPWKIILNDISLNNINLCNTFKNENKQICTKLESFNWAGEIDFITNTSIEKNINIKSTLTISNVSITDTINNIPILTNKTINLSNFKMNGIDKLSFESFSIEGFKIFPGTEKVKNIALLDNLKINQLHLTNTQQLNIKDIVITGIGANIIFYKNKLLNIQQHLSTSLPISTSNIPAEKHTESIKTSKKSLAIKIGNLRIEDSHSLSFIDQRLNTAFNMSSTIKQLAITNIDTTVPTASSHVKLSLITNDHGTLELDGDIQLFSDPKEFNISGYAKGIDLRPISSYLETSIGHKIKSGQLNADIKLSATKGSIDSLLSLNLKKFKLRPVSDKEKAKLDKELGLGMPLDIALDLLRDNDDSIDIKLPITGDVKSPEFDPSDAIYTAMSKAITAAIINYYTPFGLINVAEGLFDLATALHFEPIVFDANKSTILASHETRLNKITQLMKQRPKLHLTLCGLSNKEDLSKVSSTLYAKSKEGPENISLNHEAMQKLTDIASKRSKNIKAYFINNEIAANRLILCEPEYKHNGIAGVELSL